MTYNLFLWKLWKKTMVNINLINGNCKELLTKFDDCSFDTILTDPPYGMDFQSNRAKGGPRHSKIEGDNILDLSWIKESYRLLRKGGAILVFCEWKNAERFKVELETSGFTVKSQVIWNRLHHGMGDLLGSFAPMHDIIWYATKGRRTFVNGRPKSIIEAKRPSPSEDFGHPTCKPVDLLEKLLMYTDDGSSGNVLDPFMGSGSTGVACKNLNRDFTGIEIKEEYYKVCKERLSYG